MTASVVFIVGALGLGTAFLVARNRELHNSYYVSDTSFVLSYLLALAVWFSVVAFAFTQRE